ncbi:MAG: ABC transporter permease [Dehalococcoidales bacterium]|nr:ABC transporter permease [Dehalococcoidales bacterium]
MNSIPAAISGFEENPPRVSALRRILNVMMVRKLPAIGLAIILVTIIVAIFAPWIAPYDPYQPDLDDILSQPTGKHLLGTDLMGRDTLSRIIYGTRTSLLIGVTAIGVASVIGMTLGLLAGFLGGITNVIIMRLVDALMAFPMILLALAIAATLGGGLRNIIMALGITLVSVYARLMCGQVLSVKQNDYIMAVKSLGAENFRIMLRHILPNCFPPLIVLITLMLGTAILAEAGLSFLGVGIEPPQAAWGAMVKDGYKYLLTRPILSFAPGLTIMIVVFAFNMVGDGLRDALDPRLRGTM